jgi:hypothetical protein
MQCGQDEGPFKWMPEPMRQIVRSTPHYTLTLVKTWFDKVARGDKDEEYRPCLGKFDGMFAEPFKSHVLFRCGYNSRCAHMFVPVLGVRRVAVGDMKPNMAPLPSEPGFRDMHFDTVREVFAISLGTPEHFCNYDLAPTPRHAARRARWLADGTTIREAQVELSQLPGPPLPKSSRNKLVAGLPADNAQPMSLRDLLSGWKADGMSRREAVQRLQADGKKHHYACKLTKGLWANESPNASPARAASPVRSVAGSSSSHVPQQLSRDDAAEARPCKRHRVDSPNSNRQVVALAARSANDGPQAAVSLAPIAAPLPPRAQLLGEEESPPARRYQCCHCGVIFGQRAALKAELVCTCGHMLPPP